MVRDRLVVASKTLVLHATNLDMEEAKLLRWQLSLVMMMLIMGIAVRGVHGEYIYVKILNDNKLHHHYHLVFLQGSMDKDA